MAKWRMKGMPISEWPHFQQLFAEFQLLYCRDEPDLALFVKTSPGTPLDELYITGPKLDVIERFSPGGWEDSDAPAGEGVLLLVGDAKAAGRLGVAKQPRARD